MNSFSDAPIRVPLPQSTHRLGALLERRLRVAGRELRREPRQPRAEGERLDTSARADGRVQEEEQRARVGVHRAGHVAEHDELARHVLARAIGPVDGVAAGAQRAADEPPHVEHVAARVGRRRREARSGLVRAIVGISRRTRRYSSGVISAKSFSRSSSCAEAPSSSGSPSRSVLLGFGVALDRDVDHARRLLLAGLQPRRRQHRRPQEPGVEGPVEEIELVVARDERLAQREVDVLLTGQVDRVERAQRVGDAPGPDLEPDLAQDTAEGDDVADDGVAVGTRAASRAAGAAPRRRAARASRRAPARCPRGT